MSGVFDLVVRGGTVYDGAGSEPYVADVGVRDGKFAEIGTGIGRGEREIDADGLVVTPGFVDIHTHYDGQVVWDSSVAPSSWHGVTTVVMGNCGVGFAPCKPADRDGLINLMEGVEDIPSPVMHEGLTWDWETYPEYLDAISSQARDIDVCALLPHAPLRVYVMGERALRLEPADKQDIEKMRSLVSEAIGAGAFGVSTSRTTSHQSINGDFTPTLLAREREIMGLMMGMSDAGRGFLQIVTEIGDSDVIGEYQMMVRAAQRSARPVYYSLIQSDEAPELWREIMRFSDEARASGTAIRPVVAPRATGMLLGLEGSQNLFSGTRTYHAMRDLPLASRVAELRRPEVRAAILSDDPLEFSTFAFLTKLSYENMYRFGQPPNYTPTRDDSLQAIAEREGREPPQVAYDIMLENDGMGFIYIPFSNYSYRDLSACEAMLKNPNSIMGLSDGGAHVGFILDAGYPTWLLTHWVRDRGAFTLQEAIRRLTADGADAVGLVDRGRIAVGKRADLNVIDMNELDFEAPYVAYDLPRSGKRLMQRARGYRQTIVAGEVTYESGVPTGAQPGRLVRSA